MWLLLIPLVLTADPATGKTTSPASPPTILAIATSQQTQPTQVIAYHRTQAKSLHFEVHSVAQAPTAAWIAAECEGLCAGLRKKWLKADTPAHWKQRCEVILHGTLESYLAAVGRGGQGTRGSSLLSYDSQGVATRRIDLLATPARSALSALPHELTHVVLADRFGQRRLPRWADEGLATMADSAEKQRLHHVDLKRGMAAGLVPRMSELLFSAGYPPANRRAVYYGASLSLVQFLSALDHPERVLHFIERSQEAGHTSALREVYDIQSVHELESRWRAHLAQKK